MEKNYEVNPEKSKYLKENLLKKYPEIFEKYEIDELSENQVCNLSEFLLKEHPEKYEKDRAIYESDENLKRIYAVIDKEKESAILINTSDEGKMPEGEFGTYDFQKNHFKTSNQVKEEIVKYLGIGAFEIEKQDEIIDNVFKDLDDMDKLATMDLNKVIDERRPEVDKLINEGIDKTNEENGKTPEERKKYEEKQEQEEKVVIANENEAEEKEVPEDVEKACMRLGVTKIKGYFYVNAKQLGDKVDDIPVNENGGRVLVIESANTSNLVGPDRYYGFQDERMILYGTQDKEMEEVTERGSVPPTDGKLVEPLKKDNPTYVEFSDSQGMYVKEKIEEDMNLSVQDLENYKKEQEELLEKYSQNVMKIKQNPEISEEQKVQMLEQNNNIYNNLNMKLGQEYGINIKDINKINYEQDEIADEKQEEIIEDKEKTEDEPEAWEVPGRRKRGE